MKTVVEVSGWLLLLQGIGGVINNLWGWWGWAHGLLVVNLLDGYRIFAAIALGVLGFALLAAAGSLKKGDS
ncbi:hypothetical protein ACIBG8_17835 [Nonomuraea sp. NPDC050556]|uniref:hypothetical protein n=1 Tax=Nonomuraea sp. NPDC050556 TaxID=3364369 RepID=UPI0037BBA47A